ncbi:MAG: DMT family transporter [Pseudomonadota bacterium]
MFPLWIPITFAAAFFQCVRTALQRQLRASELSTNGATFTRYFYSFPLAILYLASLMWLTDLPWLAPNGWFLFYCLLGGGAQILATSLLIYLFSLRNFVVGTTYSKTEVIQTAAFGFILLGDPVGPVGIIAILISLSGVVLLSQAKNTDQGRGLRALMRQLVTAWGQREAWIGLICGALFAIAAVGVRAASLSLGGDGFLIESAMTLAFMTTLQTIILGFYLFLREREQLRLVIISWRKSALVGLFSVLGSAGWFSAMTLQNAAYVRALGQVELVFTFITSRFIFGERSSRTELAGVVLVAGGILLLLVGR